MTELLTVVAAIDDSDGARDALRLAALLADEENGGRLLAAHAVPPMGAALERVLFPYSCFGDDYDALRAELVDATGRSLVSSFKKLLGRNADSLRVGQGPVVPTLLELFGSLGPDIVVAGGNAQREPWRLGSVADHLVRRTPVPVILARPIGIDPPQISRIIVAVDLADETVELVASAVRLAHRLGAQVQPIFVLPTAGDAEFADLQGGNPGVSGKTKKAVTARWTHLESQLDLPFPIESELSKVLRRYIATSGDPGPKLVELVQETEADLIIVGRCRRAGGADLALGRVAEYVARHAGCHVMLHSWDETE